MQNLKTDLSRACRRAVECVIALCLCVYVLFWLPKDQVLWGGLLLCLAWWLWNGRRWPGQSK